MRSAAGSLQWCGVFECGRCCVHICVSCSVWFVLIWLHSMCTATGHRVSIVVCCPARRRHCVHSSLDCAVWLRSASKVQGARCKRCRYYPLQLVCCHECAGLNRRGDPISHPVHSTHCFLCERWNAAVLSSCQGSGTTVCECLDQFIACSSRVRATVMSRSAAASTQREDLRYGSF